MTTQEIVERLENISEQCSGGGTDNWNFAIVALIAELTEEEWEDVVTLDDYPDYIEDEGVDVIDAYADLLDSDGYAE